MRRTSTCIWLILAALCGLLLGGCAQKNRGIPGWRDALYLRKNPIPTFTREESEAMLHCIQGNRALAADGMLYTLELDPEHVPVLSCYRMEAGIPTDHRVLVSHCAPKWLTLYAGELYYVNAYQGNRMEKFSLSTGETTVLKEADSSYLQLREGRLYYCNAAHQFCSAELDGKNEQILLDKPVCYAYFTGEMLLFQSESEGNSLRLRIKENTGWRELVLSEKAVYAPVILEDRLCYTQEGKLHSMSLDGSTIRRYETLTITGAAEYFSQAGQWMARCVTEDYGIRQWQITLADGNRTDCPWRGYRYCDFQSGELRIEAEYFTDARLRAFVLVSEEEEKAEYLYGVSREPG